MTRPEFVVYNESHVEPILAALYGKRPDWAYISKTRLHMWDDSYVARKERRQRKSWR